MKKVRLIVIVLVITIIALLFPFTPTCRDFRQVEFSSNSQSVKIKNLFRNPF